MSEQSVVIRLLTTTNLVAGVILYAFLAFAVSLLRAPRYPTSIPWEGHGSGWLAGLRNTFDAITTSKKWVKHGYETYNRHGKSFVLPSTFGASKEIVIPREQMAWMLDQPDSVLSTSQSHYDSLHGEYSFIDKTVLKDPYHEHVIHKNLSRNLNAIIPELSDEVVFNVDTEFGQDTTQWKKVNIMESFLKVIPRLTNRMLVGPDLCRNKGYLDNCLAFTMDVVRNMLLFAFTPKALKSLVGPLAALPAKYHFSKTAKFTYPLVKERLEKIRQKDAGEDKTWQEPNDYLTWHIRTAQSEGRTDQLTVRKIAMALMPLNFASIHTTSMTGHSAFLDILSTDPKEGVIGALREEAERVYREGGYEWTKVGLSQMHKTDSAIRESMRLSSFATTMCDRKVIAPQGITNEVEGWHAPYGTHISCPIYGTHTDSDLHDHPEKYDAFRYSRPREEYEARPVEERDVQEGLKLRATGMVTTSDKHFPWGHGRHACPGRFFVAHELKIVIAYLVMNYDIKPLEERPQPKWMGRNIIPPTEACIEVRRRAKP